MVLLLSTMASLRDLYSLTMDVHKRLQTPSHQTITGKSSPRPVYSDHFATHKVSVNSGSNPGNAIDVLLLSMSLPLMLLSLMCCCHLWVVRGLMGLMGVDTCMVVGCPCMHYNMPSRRLKSGAAIAAAAAAAAR